jgi:cathepsin X
MKLILGFTLLDLNLAADGHGKCFVKSNNRVELKPETPVLMLDQMRPPKALDWRNLNGVNYASPDMNQHIPHYCGACWSFAVASALSDRVRIAHPTAGNVNLAPQALLNCDLEDGGCHGGDPATAHAYIVATGGLPDDSCVSYTARGHDTGEKCEAINQCQVCDSLGCRAPEAYWKYPIVEHGIIKGEAAMLRELQRGPIVCGVAVNDALQALNSWDIFEDKTGFMEIDHAISVVGYGEEEGVKYWIIRNSWGTYFGEQGWFRLIRGVNNLAIEEDCQYAVPGTPYLINGVSDAEEEASDSPKITLMGDFGYTLPNQGPDPPTFDWRTALGYDVLTTVKNMHTPQYCEASWAFAVTSAISDRMSIARKGAWPRPHLSPQVLLNCVADCGQGTQVQAYEFIKSQGVTDETCQVYEGQSKTCLPENLCENCAPGNDEKHTIWPGTCVPETHFSLHKIQDYGHLASDRASLKAELKNGPITCQTPHGIAEILGWTPTSWIARLALGTIWGERGYAYLEDGQLSDCMYARVNV